MRVVLPYHLRNLARISEAEITVDIPEPVTISSILEAIEATYPMLRGTIREHETLQRRPFVRFFCCGEDISFAPYETMLPNAIAQGAEPFMIVGAIAGG